VDQDEQQALNKGLYGMGKNVKGLKILGGCYFRKGKNLGYCRDSDS
jgi:hypothetical protein